MHARSPLTTLITTAFITCGTVLLAGWPTVTHAEDDSAQAAEENQEELQPDAAKIGALLATTRLVKDERTGAWRVRLVAQNPSTDRQELATIEVVVERQVANPMSRSAPDPEIAWSRQTRIVLPPGESFERDYLLPVEISRSITKALEEAREPAKAAEDEEPPTITTYFAQALPPDPERSAG